jgi:hypothetical protein
MSVTAILIEPHRVTRVIFDGHDLAIGDQQRIAQAIECSLDQADGEAAADDLRATRPAVTSVPRAAPDDH